MKKIARLEFKSNSAKKVSVAGDFNRWCGSEDGILDLDSGKMTRDSDGIWFFELKKIDPGTHFYKFIVDEKWEHGQNRTFFIDENLELLDPTGGIKEVVLMTPNLIKVEFSDLAQIPTAPSKEDFKIFPEGEVLDLKVIDAETNKGVVLELTCDRINVCSSITLEISNLCKRPIIRPVKHDGLFQNFFISDKELGVTIDPGTGDTIFRVFAPRATAVKLRIFSDEQASVQEYEATGWKDSDGVWEISAPGVWWGKFYGFNLDGPSNDFEGFKPEVLWPDPYCKASWFHNGPSILISPDQASDGFKEWNDEFFKTPEKSELVIWEASVRDMTTHPSAKIADKLCGKYLGIVDSRVQKTVIEHIKTLGVNAVELLPVFEFDDNPPGSYHWGYMPSLFFAPEASYAVNPRGGQVNEFKAMVNALHKEGLAVILDVVYNHTGLPNTLMGMDKQYYFRHDGNMGLLNFSGCGNDLKTENPMVRKLIIDSLKHWIQEYHIDGFRFDLAELIDHQTLIDIERELTSIKEDIVLIAEPWSFRGTLKGKLKGTSWASWNDDFRNGVRDFCLEKLDSDKLGAILCGSLKTWTDHPLQAVNYVESHDNYTLVDHLSQTKTKNGSQPMDIDIRRNLFCAGATMLSPGIPMIAGGQEMLRSKKGNENSYNAGDEINWINYDLKKKFPSVFNFYSGLIEFRKSRDFDLVRLADKETCLMAKEIYAGKDEIGIYWSLIEKPGQDVLILLNRNPLKSALFELKINHGAWRRAVGDYRVFLEKSIESKEIYISRKERDKVQFLVPPMGIEVWIPEKNRNRF